MIKNTIQALVAKEGIKRG